MINIIKCIFNYYVYLVFIIVFNKYSLLFIIMHLESRQVLLSQHGLSQHLELVSPPLFPTLSQCSPWLILWSPLMYSKLGSFTLTLFHIVVVSSQGILKPYRCDLVLFALSFGARLDFNYCLNLQVIHLVILQ